MQERQKGSHTCGVWLVRNGSSVEYLLAVSRRIFMGLEKRLCKTTDKGGCKIRIDGLDEQSFQKEKGGDLRGRKNTEPFLFLYQEKLQPAAQLGKSDGEALAEFFHSRKVQEILSQNPEDEKQAIAGVRDDEVRENGMGMATGTDEAQDAEAVPDR